MKPSSKISKDMFQLGSTLLEGKTIEIDFSAYNKEERQQMYSFFVGLCFMIEIPIQQISEHKIKIIPDLLMHPRIRSENSFIEHLT